MHRFHQMLAAVLTVVVLMTAAVLYAQEAAPDADKPAANAATEDKPAEGGEENAASDENKPAEEPKPADENAPADENKPADENAAEPAANVEPAKGSIEDLWGNLMYYIKIAKPAEAKSYAMGIAQSLKGGETADKLYQLTVKTAGWQATLTRGGKLEGLAPVLGEVRKAIEEGYNIVRADPAQIGHSIDMLGTGITAYELGVSRLRDSGEYAMPQLIQRLTDAKTPAVLRERIVNVLPRMELAAVRPLCVAVLTDNEELQVICANALGQIGYPQAGPSLRELAGRQGVLPKVKEAAERALAAVSGKNATKRSAAELYYELAENYYKGAQSLSPDSRFATANVWYWKDGHGLTYKPVPREIFNDIYAMRNAALALKADPNFYPAVSLWLAANFKREADLPAGAKDPTLGDNEMSAKFYALASSAKYLQDVLARGMNDQNSAVAIGAITALDETAGAGNLVAAGANGGVQPLVKALTYPDRKVRYLAAVTLAKALPSENFPGSDLVANVLNDAIRQSGTRRALVVVNDDKTRNVIKDALRGAGFDVIDEPDPAKAKAAARNVAGVDVCVLAERPGAAEFINLLRRDPSFMAVPAAVLDNTVEFGRFAQKDKRTIVIEKLEAAAVTAAATKALELGAGKPLGAEEASAWAVKAANAVCELGLTNNTVLDVKYTRPALIAATKDKRPEVQTAAAGALAMMNVAEAQRAIVALAVAGGNEKVRIAAFASMSKSVKKFGNMLTDEQAQSVIGIVNDVKASRELRNAAAGALGALNLPSEKIKSLIPLPVGA